MDDRGFPRRRLVVWTATALADLSPLVAAATGEALRAHGYQSVQGMIAFGLVDLPPDVALKLVTGATGAHLRDLLAAYRSAYVRLLADGLEPRSGIEQLLGGLEAAGVGSAVVSWSHRSEVVPLLNGLGLARWLEPVLTSDDVARPETTGAMALRACRSTGVDTADAILVAASPSEVMAGTDGIPTVAAKWGARDGVSWAHAEAEAAWTVERTDQLADLFSTWLAKPRNTTPANDMTSGHLPRAAGSCTGTKRTP